jgi:hydrogenase maturation protease
MPPSASPPTLVVGLGNTLMRDEGVGVHVLRELRNRAASHPDRFSSVRFEEMAVGGLALLHVLEGVSRAVLVDCAKMGAAPGEFRRFTPEGVASVKRLAGFSLHEVDILRVIELAGTLGQRPAEVVILGIEPEDVSYGEGLSATLEARLGEYVRAVQAALDERSGPANSGP